MAGHVSVSQVTRFLSTFTKTRASFGWREMGQDVIMCSAVCSFAPHTQAAVETLLPNREWRMGRVRKLKTVPWWNSYKRLDCDRHGLGSKLICAVLLCPWKKHFTALFSAWRYWQAILNFSRKAKKQIWKISIGQQ